MSPGLLSRCFNTQFPVMADVNGRSTYSTPAKGQQIRIYWLQRIRPEEWIFIQMNIYKAIWHFGRRCFLLGGATINCALCRSPPSWSDLWSRLNNWTFTLESGEVARHPRLLLLVGAGQLWRPPPSRRHLRVRWPAEVGNRKSTVYRREVQQNVTVQKTEQKFDYKYI